jgi:hypothetical protein
MRSGGISYRSEPNHKEVPAELIPLWVAGFATAMLRRVHEQPREGDSVIGG